MKTDIICVGKIKEKYLEDAIKEYMKRLGAYTNTEIIEVKDEKTPDNASEKEIKKILETEGARIRKYMDDKAHIFAMAIEGKQLTSEAFAKRIDDIGMTSSKIQFIIGGSLGIDESIKKDADELLSFSKMTFPHQLMRVVLLEQIYRAHKIIKDEPYHK
ncbi:MAG: 23S rRNA (pseudouridine(1915)-N(3))-methyltransferase RlmH [Lachnospiraceae bacterium]|nr:23S rRNA (pseudouridine(1915)-N(3))-methyltransferase RlmH [Lachnospiraceae bacterium]